MTVYRPNNLLDEIYPNLYLGNLTAAESPQILEAYAITDILSITSHRPRIPKNFNIRKKHFKLRDNNTSNLLAILPDAISRLEQILKEDDGGIDEHGRVRRVLVHCRMGMSRSGGVVVAYVMKFAQIPAELALEYVRSMRPIVNPNRAFMAQLTLWGDCGYDVSFLEDPEKYVGGVDGAEGGESEGGEEDMLRKAIEMSLVQESVEGAIGGVDAVGGEGDVDVLMGEDPAPLGSGEGMGLEDPPLCNAPEEDSTPADTPQLPQITNTTPHITQPDLHSEWRHTKPKEQWTKVIMRDGMKRRFEECIRDVGERLELRIEPVS